MRIRRVAGLAVLLVAALIAAASAAVVEDIARDFKSLSGYVVMPVADEFLIDRDAGDGVAVGDLFAVVKPGERIVHPVTGEVLGALDEVKGLLQVTRLKSGYAYARPVSGAKGIERGDLVRRFENVPTAFWDYQGSGEELYDGLKAALPLLEWQGYVRLEEQEQPDAVPPLVFALRGGSLEVLGPEGRALRSYPVAASKSMPSPVAASTSPPPAPASLTPLPVSPPAGVIVAPPTPAAAPAIIRQQGVAADGIWMSPELKGEAAGVAVADLDGDGRQEIAVAFPYRLEIGRIADGRYERMTDLDLGLGQKVVSLDSADLDGDGAAELYLTAVDRGELQSLAVALRGGSFAVTHRNLPWYFRTVRLPGGEETLLAQAMGGLELDFAGPLVRVEMKGEKLLAGEVVTLPKGVELYGFGGFRGPAGEELFAQLSFMDHLKVMRPTGEVVWQGEERFGGGEAFVERKDPSKNPADGPDTRHVFMQKRLELGPAGELLVPVNEGSRVLKRSRSFDRSHIRGMVWNGFALQELWRTRPQEAYLADFRLADVDNDGKQELVQVLVFTREGVMSKPRSAVAVYELP